jgi:hypothetical protein
MVASHCVGSQPQGTGCTARRGGWQLHIRVLAPEQLSQVSELRAARPTVAVRGAGAAGRPGGRPPQPPPPARVTPAAPRPDRLVS